MLMNVGESEEGPYYTPREEGWVRMRGRPQTGYRLLVDVVMVVTVVAIVVIVITTTTTTSDNNDSSQVL